MNNDDEVKIATEIAKAALENTTLYDDAFKPAAKQVGKSLETVTKTIDVALSPLKGLIWGYEQLEYFLKTRVAPKLQQIPEDQIIQPDLYVVGPALESLKFTDHKEDSIQELFANLLANSLDKQTAYKSHPSFVQVLKNMTPDEAKILHLFVETKVYPIIDVLAYDNSRSTFNIVLRNFSLLGSEANCQHQQLTNSYIDNLSRLGVLRIREDQKLDVTQYAFLEGQELIWELRKQITNNNKKFEIRQKLMELTDYGQQFVDACVIQKSTIV